MNKAIAERTYVVLYRYKNAKLAKFFEGGVKIKS